LILTNYSSIPILSLFSGAGFLDMGFMNQGFSIERAFEINERFIEGHNFAMKHYCDLSRNEYFKKNIISFQEINKSYDVSEKGVQKEIGLLFKGISGIIGGPPCQDYSIGGKNLGINGERGKLIHSYFRIIKNVKPDFLFFENVEGLYKTKVHQLEFLSLIRNLSDLGYILSYKIINPLNYGFPQDRPRIIVVGFKKKIVKRLIRNGYTLLEDCTSLIGKNDESLVFKWPKELFSTPKNILWPHSWKFGADVNYNEINNIPVEYHSLQVINSIRDLDDNHPNQTEYFNPYSPKFKLIDEGDTRRKSFKRLHRYKFSPTVAYGNNEVHLHPTLPRRLSVREALRIQTVPDEYILPKSLPLTIKFKMISNGVPSAQAELIAQEIRRTLINYYTL
jgi:DNA (cytosine-5)-methyltransferase 1